MTASPSAPAAEGRAAGTASDTAPAHLDPPSGLHVVVGAGGAVGRPLVAALAAAGIPVRAVTRDGRDVGTPGAQRAAADAADPAALAAVCAGAAVVHHCVLPDLLRWVPDLPVVTDALVSAAAATGARLVYADDTWMYGLVDGPMTEDTPWRPVSGHGVLRAWVAERLLAEAARGRVRVSVVRAGELYGAGVRSLLAGNVFGNALRGRPVHLVGNPDLPLTPTHVADFAATLAAAGRFDEADAGVWHVPHPPATTARGLAAEACAQAGTRLRVLAHGAGRLRALGTVSRVVRVGAAMVYQFEQPFVVDGSRAARLLDVRPTPYAAGVAATLAALRRA